MAINSTLPEGTDSIVTGASSAEIDRSGDYAGAGSFGAAPAYPDASSKLNDASSKLGDAAAKVGDATAGLRAQAADKARDYAVQGKERAVGGLENVAKLVDDAAQTIDDKVGAQYGEYARSASKLVAGFADTLREKDVDELFTDARDAVRKSPAIAIGAAAAIGFVIARLVKASTPDTVSSDSAATDTPTAYTPASSAYTPPAASTPTAATTVPVDTSF